MAIEQNNIITANDITQSISELNDKISNVGTTWVSTTLYEGNLAPRTSTALASDTQNFDFISISVKHKVSSAWATAPFSVPTIIPSSQVSWYNSGSNVLSVDLSTSIFMLYFTDSSHIYLYEDSSYYFRILGLKLKTSTATAIETYTPHYTNTILFGPSKVSLNTSYPLTDSIDNYEWIHINACYNSTWSLPPVMFHSSQRSMYCTANTRIQLNSEADYVSFYFPTSTTFIESTRGGSIDTSKMYITITGFR